MSVQAIRKELAEFRRWEREFFRARDRPDKSWTKAQVCEIVSYWVNSFGHLIEGVYAVANAKSKPKNGKVDFKGFVNYRLSEEDKENFMAWEYDDHDLFLLIAGDNQQGYKLTMSFNSENDTFVATYMCNDPESPNAGYCLSAYGNDWYLALKTLTFKHNVVLEGQWNVDKAKQQDSWG